MKSILLESYLHSKIRQTLANDTEFQNFMGKRELEPITRQVVEAYQLFQLKKTLVYAYGKSSFYRIQFDKRGIRPEKFQSLADLARFPFTEPGDIAQDPYAFACVSQDAIARATTFISSGTTGPQKRVFFTEGDLERMTDFMAAGMRTVASSGDVVQIMLPSGPPNSQADLLAKGVKKMGGLPVVTGAAPTSTQIEAIKESHPKVLFGSTSRIYRLTKEAERVHNLASHGVEVVFTTSEYLSSSMRENLRRSWHADVVTHYGLTEMGLGVAIECQIGDGYHFNETDLLLEIVDPETGEVLKEGEEGEMVFTTLDREAMPILRYRTHDISRLMDNACDCGAATSKKFAPVTRRKEAVVKLGNAELYPSFLDEALHKIAEIVDWQAELVRDCGKESLRVRVEVVGGREVKKDEIRDALLEVPAIRQNLEHSKLNLSHIEILHPGSLTRTTRAKKLILDNR